MEENLVKLAVLEQKIEDLKPIVLRIDAAIEKLSEVNTTVSRMLAVHEERITKQEEVDYILFAKIDKLRDKMQSLKVSFIMLKTFKNLLILSNLIHFKILHMVRKGL